MQTQWGEVRLCDAHVHFFSHNFFSLLAAQRNSTVADIAPLLADWQLPPEDPRALASRWVGELDRHGVERAALIASLPGDELSVGEAIAAYPERLAGFFMVNPLAQNASESVKAALQAGLRGLCFFPAMHRYTMRDDRVGALIELAAQQARGCLIFAHCGVLSVGIRKKLGLSSPFDMHYSNPLDLHHLALRFPALPFLVPHFGGGLFREALMLADLCPNAHLDTSSSNGWMKYDGLELAQVFRRAIEVAGAKRLLFGTDSSFFPRGWHRRVFDAQAEALAAAGITDENAHDIFGGNFRRLLPSPVPPDRV